MPAARAWQLLLAWLAGFDAGRLVDALRNFSCAEGLAGFNFLRDRRPLAALFERVWR